MQLDGHRRPPRGPSGGILPATAERKAAATQSTLDAPQPISRFELPPAHPTEAIAKPRPLRSFRTHPCTRPACQSLAIRQGRASRDATLSWLAIAVVIFKSPAPHFQMRTLCGTFSNPTARKARPTRQEFPHQILIRQQCANTGYNCQAAEGQLSHGISRASVRTVIFRQTPKEKPPTRQSLGCAAAYSPLRIAARSPNRCDSSTKKTTNFSLDHRRCSSVQDRCIQWFGVVFLDKKRHDLANARVLDRSLSGREDG